MNNCKIASRLGNEVENQYKFGIDKVKQKKKILTSH